MSGLFKTGISALGKWILFPGVGFMKPEFQEAFLNLDDDLKKYYVFLLKRGGLVTLTTHQAVDTYKVKLGILYNGGLVWKADTDPYSKSPVYTINYLAFFKPGK